MSHGDHIKITEFDFRRLHREVASRFHNTAPIPEAFVENRIRKRRPPPEQDNDGTSKTDPTFDQIYDIAIEMGFGVSEAIALASLLFTVWVYYRTGSRKQVVACRKRFNGKLCGHPYVFEEKEIAGDEQYIVLWCEKKHKTKMRIK